MGPGEVSAIMFASSRSSSRCGCGVFLAGGGVHPHHVLDERLSPIILITEMNKAFGASCS